MDRSLDARRYDEMGLEQIGDLVEEMRSIPVGQLRCNDCGEMVTVNGRYMDILISRGISSIGNCSACREKKRERGQ